MHETKTPFGTGLVRFIAVMSFAFILFMPVSQGEIMVAVFGLMVLAAFLTCLRTGRALSLPIAAVAWLIIILGAYGLAVGHQNDGFMNAAGIFVGTPLLFFFCIAALGHGSIKALLSTGAIMTVVSGVFILLYVGGQQGILPQVIPSNILKLTGAGYGEKGDATAIRFYGLSTLAASGPMWLASLFVRSDGLLPRPFLRFAAAAAGASGAILGGRRAIILTLILIPVIAWMVKRSTTKPSGPSKIHPRYMITGLALSIVAVLAAPQLAPTPIFVNTWRATVSFFTGSSSDISADESIRTYQAERLFAEWVDSPIWGHGLGATIIGYQRSDAQPWQFEMQYQAFLMQTGIIGVALVVLIAALIWRAVRTASRLRPDLVPSLVVTLCGGVAMLIANATNPYLQAPAHHWAIFLPLAVINMMLRNPPPEDMPREVGVVATQGVTK